MLIASREIKNKFLNFFIKNNHLQIKNSSIIPQNDPTLLFINSGMAAIKNYFAGEEKPTSSELCNVQSCIRTVDIEDVGDTRHLTSFQMLGSWSIGSYFKEKAINLAFEFLTNHLMVPVKKLYVSVFSGNEKLNLPFDDEAKNFWMKSGIDESHIISLGMKDNFWGPASETGPCGPCTEVFFDTGTGKKYIGGHFDTSRYIEIWNAGVFMTLSKNSDGTFGNLAFKSVDTGAGLERLSMVLNGYESVYDIDILKPIKDFLKKLLDANGMQEPELRILTDHIRTAALILSERIIPSNEGRGYVLRKIIRKCSVTAKKVNKNYEDLTKVVEFIIENFSDMNENFLKNRDFIINNFKDEKERFELVLENGSEKLEILKSKGKIDGGEAFELASTFGIPFEILKDYSKQNNLDLDENGYLQLLENHKSISRGKTPETSGEREKIFIKSEKTPKTKFVGYNSLSVSSKILKIFLSDGQESESISALETSAIVLDTTSAYAKSGGQESDHGRIFKHTGETCSFDCVLKKDDIFVHFCKIENGKFSLGDKVVIEIDSERRKKMSRAHSATHLLQSALKTVLGNQVRQHGSKIEENKLHFDFNFDGVIAQKELSEIENIVNKNITENILCRISEKPLAEAVKQGASALFNEKYGDVVRVVEFGNASKELCGGTHVTRTGEIGVFLITSCSGIGKGTRRICAVLAEDALEFIRRRTEVLEAAEKLAGAKSDEFLARLEKMVLNNQDKKKLPKKIDEKNLKYINAKFPCALLETERCFENSEILKLARKISGIIIFISKDEKKHEKKRIVLAVSENLKLRADEILNAGIKNLGGKCGGNSKLASGGISGVSTEKIIKKIIDYMNCI